MKRFLIAVTAIAAFTSLLTVPVFSEDKLVVQDGTFSIDYNNSDFNTPAINVISSATSGGQSVVGFNVGGVLKGKVRVDSSGNMGIETSGTGNIAYNFSGGAGDVKYWNGSGGLLAIIKNSGRLGLGVASPAYPIQVSNGAYLSTGGIWTNVSSREAKKNIRDLSAGEAMSAFEELKPVTFTYKAAADEHHVGFIAEDVPDLVATKDRKGLSTLDIVAVLTKVVQEQQKTISELKEKVTLLEGNVAKIKSTGVLCSVISE